MIVVIYMCLLSLNKCIFLLLASLDEIVQTSYFVLSYDFSSKSVIYPNDTIFEIFS